MSMNSQVASAFGSALVLLGLAAMGAQIIIATPKTGKAAVYAVQHGTLGHWGMAGVGVGIVLWCTSYGLPTAETQEKRREAWEKRYEEERDRRQRLADSERLAEAAAAKNDREIQEFGAVLARALETSEPSTSRKLSLTVQVGNASVKVENAFDVEADQRAKAIAEATERVRIANEQARLGTQQPKPAVQANKNAVPPPDEKKGKW